MKIVIFKGGLGNQLFQFGQYCNLISKGYKVKALNFCTDHNGFELEKYFNAKLDFIKSRLCSRFFMCLVKLPSFIRRNIIIDRFKYSENRFAVFYNDFWQSKMFLPKGDWIKFQEMPLNENNTKTVNDIMRCNSVALHIRRGDYLKAGCSELFTNLCETDYYKTSIDFIKKQVQNPSFYVFSNDIDWCRNNLDIENCTYVDWNTGNDSVYDMYLMSKCKYVIIANSTFSFWGAYLNKRAKIVIYPRNWYNGFKDNTLDIFPANWIIL